ncbi:MAG TPA: cysteine peptidase family C39 domain-containing protein [Candidatus Nanoarchaeia archaeon]|nr:cysteine peptidase family C39 domain-containing protein [Candidatus Nanoarchaeia archaeon]
MAQFSFHKQEKDYTCGAASMKMALESCNIKKSEKQIVKLLRSGKSKGTWNKDFPIIAEKFKLNHLSMRNAAINDLKEYQKRGFTIIIGYFYPLEKFGHYAVLKKIDAKKIYLSDPYFGDKHSYALDYFKKIWKNDPKYDKEKRWFFAVKKR